MCTARHIIVIIDETQTYNMLLLYNVRIRYYYSIYYANVQWVPMI